MVDVIDEPWSDLVSLRRRGAGPPLVLGVASVILGGLVAAVTTPMGWQHGAWAAAYLVLVTGVAQIGLGLGQAMLAMTPPSPTLVVVQVSGWNLGSAAVILGTLAAAPAVVSVGGVLLVACLGLLVFGVRGGRAGWLLWTYRGLVLLLLVSIPVGLVLSWLRS
ncbi:MAG: hypothetical protein ABI468_08030 [Candidatus Nanopelagicales bacterium]